MTGALVGNRGSEARMRTKTYRGATMKEALARVRHDLGGSAVILGTREVRRRRLFGLGTRELVEVTAAEPPPAPEVDLSPRRARPASSPAEALQAQFGEQLGRLHAMVAEMSRQGRIDHLLPDLPGDLIPTYANLLEADVPEALA